MAVNWYFQNSIAFVWSAIGVVCLGSIAFGFWYTDHAARPKKPNKLGSSISPKSAQDEPSPPGEGPLQTQYGPRPKFSEQVETIRVGVASNLIGLPNMSDGHSEAVLKIKDKPVITARVVNNELVIDAKLGAVGAELKDNRLLHKPTGWDWNADDKSFEIINEHGQPVFQLTYGGGDVALVKGIFFDEGACWILQDVSMFAVNADDPRKIASIGLTPIFKYPRLAHHGERVVNQ